jgi:type IX secretion system PorP/SprF family membrane protein
MASRNKGLSTLIQPVKINLQIMKNVNFYTALVLLLSTVKILAQQNSNFNTYSYDLMQVSVAAMGSSAFQANLNYRTQAIKVNNPPSLYQLNSFVSLGEKHALGIKVYQNSIHLTAYNNITGAYSYRLKFNEQTSLNLGLGVSYYQVRFNAQKAVVNQYDDPNLQNDGSALRSNNFDCEVGTELKWKELKVGVAVNHLYNTDKNLGTIQNKTPREFNFYATYSVKLSSNFEMAPWFLDRYRVGYGFVPEGILNFRFKKMVGLGFGYRYSNSVMANAMVELTGFKLVYSYEYSLSNVYKQLGNTHQIMLGFDLQKKKKDPAPNDTQK